MYVGGNGWNGIDFYFISHPLFLIRPHYYMLYTDSLGPWDPPPSTILWSQPSRYSQEKAVHRSRGYMHWEVSYCSLHGSSITYIHLGFLDLRGRASNIFKEGPCSPLLPQRNAPPSMKLYMLSSRYGFVIAVTTIDNIGLGTLQPGRGFSLYPVKYKVGWSQHLSGHQLGHQLGHLFVVFPGNSVPSL